MINCKEYFKKSLKTLKQDKELCYEILTNKNTTEYQKNIIINLCDLLNKAIKQIEALK